MFKVMCKFLVLIELVNVNTFFRIEKVLTTLFLTFKSKFNLKKLFKIARRKTFENNGKFRTGTRFL